MLESGGTVFGTIAPSVGPFIRIPGNARERNQWTVKQALDQGVYGIVAPQLETVDEARALVPAMRHPVVEEALGEILNICLQAGVRAACRRNSSRWSNGSPRDVLEIGRKVAGR